MCADRNAFIMRIAPSQIDRMPEALASDEIIIGWSDAEGLLNHSVSRDEFRQIIHDAGYSHDENYRRSGSAAGHMWRFIREMKFGDWVVVPYGPNFYVAEIEGPATYHPELVEDDTANRRKVRWLNNKRPIPREIASDALQQRMAIRATSAYADDLLGDIERALSSAAYR